MQIVLRLLFLHDTQTKIATFEIFTQWSKGKLNCLWSRSSLLNAFSQIQHQINRGCCGFDGNNVGEQLFEEISNAACLRRAPRPHLGLIPHNYLSSEGFYLEKFISPQKSLFLTGSPLISLLLITDGAPERPPSSKALLPVHRAAPSSAPKKRVSESASDANFFTDVNFSRLQREVDQLTEQFDNMASRKKVLNYYYYFWALKEIWKFVWFLDGSAHVLKHNLKWHLHFTQKAPRNVFVSRNSSTNIVPLVNPIRLYWQSLLRKIILGEFSESDDIGPAVFLEL